MLVKQFIIGFWMVLSLLGLVPKSGALPEQLLVTGSPESSMLQNLASSLGGVTSCIISNPSTCLYQWATEFIGITGSSVTDFVRDGIISLSDFEFIRRQMTLGILPTTTTGPTLTPALTLLSAYFSSDTTARAIVKGELAGPMLKDEPELNIVPNQSITINYDLFQLKISSALIMLGYVWIDDAPKRIDEKPQTLLLRAQAFMRSNALPVTDVVTAPFLLSLDHAVWSHEKRIKPIVDKLPINESFTYNNHAIRYIPHHPNLVTKDHVRYFYSYLLSQLPSYVAPLSLKNTYEYFSMQGHLITETPNGWELAYIDSNNHSSLYRENYPDTYPAETLFHEYAHQTDASIFASFSPSSGMVDTAGFKAILFDTSDCIQQHGGPYCKLRGGARVISDYSLQYDLAGHPGYYAMAEPYAETFSAYVLAGNLFRKLATFDSSFANQYQWFKSNVFQNIEYCTGDQNLVSYQTRWDYAANNPPPNSTDLVFFYVQTHTNAQQPVLQLDELTKKCP